MSTISFSVDEQTKRDFAKKAKLAKKSQSELFRDLLVEAQFNQELDYHTQKMEPVFKDLGIETEQDLYDYLESGQSYEDRLRQQRLSGSH
jgi:hypothetical protein